MLNFKKISLPLNKNYLKYYLLIHTFLISLLILVDLYSIDQEPYIYN